MKAILPHSCPQTWQPKPRATSPTNGEMPTSQKPLNVRVVSAVTWRRLRIGLGRASAVLHDIAHTIDNVVSGSLEDIRRAISSHSSQHRVPTGVRAQG